MPFTAALVDGNDSARAFYEPQGARLLMTRDDGVGQTPSSERVFVWDEPLIGESLHIG